MLAKPILFLLLTLFTLWTPTSGRLASRLSRSKSRRIRMNKNGLTKGSLEDISVEGNGIGEEESTVSSIASVDSLLGQSISQTISFCENDKSGPCLEEFDPVCSFTCVNEDCNKIYESPCAACMDPNVKSYVNYLL